MISRSILILFILSISPAISADIKDNLLDKSSGLISEFVSNLIPGDGTTEVRLDLRENHGVFCSIVVYPVIPKGLIILRLIPTATHTQTDIDETIVAFSAIRDLLENGTYKKLAASMMEE